MIGISISCLTSSPFSNDVKRAERVFNSLSPHRQVKNSSLVDEEKVNKKRKISQSEKINGKTSSNRGELVKRINQYFAFEKRFFSPCKFFTYR